MSDRGFERQRANRWVRLGCLFEGSLALVGIAGSHWLGTPLLSTLHWDLRNPLLGIAATIPLLAGLGWMLQSQLAPLRGIRFYVDEVIRPALGQSSVLQMALLSLLAGVGEEFLFRGLILSAISQMAGTTIGLIVSSVLFGLCHLVTRAYGVLASVIGAYLGLLYLGTGDLIVPVVTHALYDFVALVYLLKFRPSLAR